jgi:hypothetical protein
MHDAPKAANRRTSPLRAWTLPRAWKWNRVLSLCAILIAAPALHAQTAPAAAPAKAPVNAPAAPTATSPVATSGAATSGAAQTTTQPDQAPGFTTPPVAIVPLDKSIRGAALEVDGPIEAWNGRAYLTGSGSITAGTATAEVALPSRGTLRVCASSTVKLAADASAPAGEVPGLLMALDRGAVEMSLAPSTAREKNADTLLTPYFRILIGGPNAADVKVRLGEHGDTCVDNAGVGAPYVVVSSVFDGGIYRVQPGQRVMFERGSLQSVVDQEKEPCGCPPPLAETRGNEFPLAQSEGLAPGSQAPVVSAPPATATLSYNGSDHAAQIAGPVTTAPAASATPVPATSASQAPAKQKKPGFFGKIGKFFRRIFGAE